MKIRPPPRPAGLLADLLRKLERALPATVALVKTRTRQFAKRQMTWFRRQMQIQWVTVAPEESPERIARLALALRAGPTVANSGLNRDCR
ncbi:MAG: hypothetical protein KA236_05235 [Verrucomicrobia bacterium]|nr:hypothetical protein [Verrucomicrobiota bacterium]